MFARVSHHSTIKQETLRNGSRTPARKFISSSRKWRLLLTLVNVCANLAVLEHIATKNDDRNAVKHGK